MRRIRALSIVIFIIAIVTFGINKWQAWSNSDATGPVIIMEQDSVTVSVEDGDEAILSGVSAMDVKDGDVTDSLIVETMSNFIEKGRRTVTIAAFDDDHHVTKVSREVIYSDYRSPKFTLSAPLKFPRNTDGILTYLGAEDVLDGSLTSNIKISTDYNVQVDTAGEYNVIFTVANSAGDVSELPVTVQVYDASDENQRPQISLSEYIVYTKVGQAIEPWSYVKQIRIGTIEYVRGEDGVLRSEVTDPRGNQETITSEDVTITNPADFNTPGVYEIMYQYEVENREPGYVRLVVVVE